MLKITPGVVTALEADSRDRFGGRSQQYLQGRLERPVPLPLLHGLFGDARRCGLASEQELVRFALLVLLAGGGDDARHRYIAAMGAGMGGPAQRLARLYDHARATAPAP